MPPPERWYILPFAPLSHNLIKAFFIYPFLPSLPTLKFFFIIFVSSRFSPPLTSFSLHSHTLVPQLSSPDDIDSLQFDDIRWLLSPSWNNRFVPPLPFQFPCDCSFPHPHFLFFTCLSLRWQMGHLRLLSSSPFSFAFLFSRAPSIRDLWKQHQHLKSKQIPNKSNNGRSTSIPVLYDICFDRELKMILQELWQR